MQLAREIAYGLHTACAYSAEALRYSVHHFKVGAERAGRAADWLDIGDSLLGAIAPDPDVARRAGRILAAFYIPSMPPASLEGHGIDPDEVAPVNAAFASGDINDDGAIDLIVAKADGSITAFRNEGAGKNYALLDLVGGVANLVLDLLDAA